MIKELVLCAFPKFVSGREEKLLIILSTLQVKVQHPTPIAIYYVCRKYSQYLIIKEVELVVLLTHNFLYIKMNFNVYLP